MWLIVIAVVGVGFLALFAVHHVRVEKIQESCIESLNRLRLNHDAFAIEANEKHKSENNRIRKEMQQIQWDAEQFRQDLDQKTAEFEQKTQSFSKQIEALESERDALQSYNRELDSVITNVRKVIEL